MKTIKNVILKRLILIVLFVFLGILFTSCDSHNIVVPPDEVNFSIHGERLYFAESDQQVYWVSQANNYSVFYISSFNKNADKNWEIEREESGEIYALKDGRLFYVTQYGKITAYDETGEEIFETDLDLSGVSNSNFMLNQKEELVVNLISSPNYHTVYCSINIDGEKTTSPKIPSLSTSHTYNYPLGGYIAEGFTDYNANYKWYIYRLWDDFSVKWVYCVENDGHNVWIDDISKDGKILFHGDEHGSYLNSFLKELNPKGKVVNTISLEGDVKAAYFNKKIVVLSGGSIKVLNPNFSITTEFEEEFKFGWIQAFEDSFFVYSPGSYLFPDGSYPEVIYDGYCRQYDENNLLFSKDYEQSGFAEIGDNGQLYYLK